LCRRPHGLCRRPRGLSHRPHGSSRYIAATRRWQFIWRREDSCTSHLAHGSSWITFARHDRGALRP
jgi:hypothetical protein